MIVRIGKRLGQLVITLLGVTFITFSLTYMAPGDPVAMLLETGDTIISQEVVEQTRHELGLDRPFIVQYGSWLGQALTGDLGMSYSAKKPVVDKMAEAFPGTLLLAVTSIVLMLIISIPAGVMAAVYRNRWIDYILRAVSFVGISMPTFWLGLVLLYIFGYKLGIAPIATATVSLSNVMLPAITMAFTMAAKYMRQVRLVVLEEMNKDYVIGARARGMTERAILWHHIFPNACLPLLTILGLSLGWLLGGVAVVEMVFAWPGLGKMAVQAITMRDYPLLQGFVLWAALAYMVINALIDMSYSLLDPRLRKGGHR
ncbi:nickel ABC transporter permease [Veillonella magna]|uniref:nickel ABC transporter permease n=1 Tax=Veillonella magna TaxID=464322 RepID=UPI0023F13738|nr:nickel ABC transporter permease [Veillonella magna]MBD8976468.1 ABC transporter permease [Veillonella magna]